MEPATERNRHMLRRAVEMVRARQISTDFSEPEIRAALQQLMAPMLAAAGAAPDAAALNRLGLVAAELLQYDLAAEAFTSAIAAAPQVAEYHNHLGSTFRFAGELPAAIDAYRQALRRRPNWIAAVANLGQALDLAGDSDQALAVFQQLRALTGNHVDWHVNAGTVHLHQHRAAEAIAEFRQAIGLDPSHSMAHYKLSWALLSIEEYDEGWRQYEWRTPAAEQTARRHRYGPAMWTGQDLAGRTLLLEAEQGIGDMVQFIRYAPQLASAGARVLVECPAALRPLLSRCHGVAAAVGAAEPLPQYDFHVLPMSVPLHLGTTASTIPGQVPYLCAMPKDVQRWARKVGVGTGDSWRRIGLSWAGNRLNRNDSRRSCPAAAFDRLADLADCQFFSLQKPQPFDVGRPTRLELIDHAAELDGFADTAALIANLDLVITVDTAIAHVAGAMGKPVWILLPHFADWRWQWFRSDSPWYPTARLFRQPAPGHWTAVLESVAAALRE